jgi:pheromone a factor receptor
VIALTSADAVFTIPLGVLIMYVNATRVPVTRNFDWDDVHYDFGRVDTYTVAQIAAANDPWLSFLQAWAQWIYILCAVVLFAVYGSSMDLVRFYCKWFWSLAGRLGYRRREKKKPVQTIIHFTSVVESGGSSWDERTDRDT